MEAQLAEYRAKRAKERNNEISILTKFLNYFRKTKESKGVSSEQVSAATGSNKYTDKVVKRAVVDTRKQHEVKTNVVYDEDSILSRDWKHYIPLLLKIILWLLLWKYFISHGFGAVFFIVSCLYLMYRNTGTGPRSRRGLSAYSVFNPNHERLDGTFTAEQFEKELRHGSGSVK